MKSGKAGARSRLSVRRASFQSPAPCAGKSSYFSSRAQTGLAGLMVITLHCHTTARQLFLGERKKHQEEEKHVFSKEMADPARSTAVQANTYFNVVSLNPALFKRIRVM